MANVLYPKFKEALLNKQFDMLTDSVKVALVDGGAASYNAAHQYLASIASAIVARSPALASKTIALGVFDAADVTLTAVTGPSVEIVAVWIDKGSDATNPLVGWIDTPTIAYNPNGSDAEVRFNASGIFAL